MNKTLGAGALVLALTLSACGDDAATNNAAGNGAAASAGPAIPAPNNGDWTQVVSQTPEGGFRMGNPDAPVKLVEYASMTCPHCAAFSGEASERLKNEYVRSGRVSFEFRNFVLNGPDAAASTLARCMPPSGFFRVVEELFATQRDWLGAIDEAEGARIQSTPQQQQIAAFAQAADLPAFFRQRGLPDAQISACLADPQAGQRLLDMSQKAADEHNVTGTPTFLINGETAEGNTWQQIEPLIQSALGS